jgi:NAD(P)-dependent dehydrogenase (short-subunit alcohol dehydrogenase family)
MVAAGAAPAAGTGQGAGDLGVQGRVAVVSGGARGIGLAAGRLLAARGARVVLLDRDEAALAATVAELAEEGVDAGYAAVDVRSGPACTDALDRIAADEGSLDILINSAGVHGPSRPLWEVSDAEWEDVMAVNVTGTFNLCRAAVPHMIDRWGRIVNIASIAGKEGNPSAAPYSTSKAAVIGLTKSLGKELAQHGVLVNAIAPAVVETEMVANISDEHRSYMVARIPMGRMGTVDEVAQLIAFLSSPAVSFSTGAVYDISGGRATY